MFCLEVLKYIARKVLVSLLSGKSFDTFTHYNQAIKYQKGGIQWQEEFLNR